MMAAGPVAHHGALTVPKRLRDLVVVPAGQVTWRDATAMVKLGDRVCRPDARSAIERGPQVVVEELSARRDEQLVERAEQARIAARKEESEEAGTRQRGCGVDEGVPRGRHLRTRAAGGAVEEVAAVVEQPH